MIAAIVPVLGGTVHALSTRSQTSQTLEKSDAGPVFLLASFCNSYQRLGQCLQRPVLAYLDALDVDYANLVILLL